MALHSPTPALMGWGGEEALLDLSTGVMFSQRGLAQDWPGL